VVTHPSHVVEHLRHADAVTDELIAGRLDVDQDELQALFLSLS